MKDILAKYVALRIPRILSMMDKNRLSSTYGCFDRNYWHYKKFDFASGMYQASVLTLAIAYKHDFPGNQWKGSTLLKDSINAGINYLKKCMNSDGSLDEFYPGEKALGATAFALYAATESYLILENKNPEQEKIFSKIASWLAKNEEAAQISNHLLCAAIALVNIYLITNEEKYLKAAKTKVKKALNWFCEEGWFKEHGGCDPGYHTFATDFLAKYYKKTKDKSVLPYLKKCVEFATYFMQPDNSYGGEYGSRNTSHYFPHGFEIINNEKALRINDWFICGLKERKNEFMDDDTYFFLVTNNFLQTYLDFSEKRPKEGKEKDFIKHFVEAGFVIIQDRNEYYVISTKKAAFRIFRKETNVLTDYGITGKTKNAVFTSNHTNENQTQVQKDKITIKGRFALVKSIRMTPTKTIILRSLNLTVGKIPKAEHFIKKRLVKKLITKTKSIPIEFEREIDLKNKEVIDKIESQVKIKELYYGNNTSFIQVPSSKYYQESIKEWRAISVKELNNTGRVVIKRTF